MCSQFSSKRLQSSKAKFGPEFFSKAAPWLNKSIENHDLTLELMIHGLIAVDNVDGRNPKQPPGMYKCL